MGTFPTSILCTKHTSFQLFFLRVQCRRLCTCCSFQNLKMKRRGVFFWGGASVLSAKSEHCTELGVQQNYDQTVHTQKLREEPLMIWGGGLGQKGEKQTQRLHARGKKTQLNNPEKNPTQQPLRRKNSTQQPQQLNTNCLPEAPPRSLMVRP